MFNSRLNNIHAFGIFSNIYVPFLDVSFLTFFYDGIPSIKFGLRGRINSLSELLGNPPQFGVQESVYV